MSHYVLPIAAAVLILLFYLGLPELNRVNSVRIGSDESFRCANKRIDRFDILIMAVFVAVFGPVDFYRLGNSSSVESFVNMDGRDSVIMLSESAVPSEIAFFSGVGYGTYTFEFSEDGENFHSPVVFTQNAGDVLRWNYVNPDTEQLEKIRFLRISGSGNAYLGEVCIAEYDDESGMRQIPVMSDIPELSDEQELFCLNYNFMNSSYFDEIYHARTAWEHLHNVYPYEISHPPLGKLIISLGIALFGMTPFGWRFSGTLFGVLMLPVAYVFIKKLFGTRRTAAAGTLVFAADFMHFVQTRIATIDTYAVFFILLMYLFMYIYVSEGKLRALALSGVFFGLGAASKWTCIYAGAGLALIWAVHWIVNRKRGFKAFSLNALFCILFFVFIPCLVYYLSYIPYGTAQNVRNVFSREYLDIVLSNQEYMFSYHSNLVAEHPYSSVWYQWILDIRPILYYLEYNGPMRSSFGAFLNPVLCWGGLLALFVLIYEAVIRADRDALFIVIGYLAQLVPWIFVTRLTFEYHYFPCSVFLVLAVAYVFHIMEEGTPHCKIYIWGFTGLSLAVFVLFFPALTGISVDNTQASALMRWLPTWPF